MAEPNRIGPETAQEESGTGAENQGRRSLSGFFQNGAVSGTECAFQVVTINT